VCFVASSERLSLTLRSPLVLGTLISGSLTTLQLNVLSFKLTPYSIELEQVLTSIQPCVSATCCGEMHPTCVVASKRRSSNILPFVPDALLRSLLPRSRSSVP
jgi:hypothetical protein